MESKIQLLSSCLWKYRLIFSVDNPIISETPFPSKDSRDCRRERERKTVTERVLIENRSLPFRSR